MEGVFQTATVGELKQLKKEQKLWQFNYPQRFGMRG